MIQGALYRSNNQQLILPHVMKTSSVLERMQGLLCRQPLEEDEGFLIQPCSSIHTFGMAYPIDVIFLSRDWTIKKIFTHVKPWRFCISMGAAMVLEMLSGAVEKHELVEEMDLKWETTK